MLGYQYLCEIWHEQTIDDKAWSILRCDWHLLDLSTELKDAIKHFSIGMSRANHLHELHQLHRIEEMQTHELLWSTRGQSHVRDGQGRSIRSKDRVRGSNLTEMRIEIQFHFLDLDDGLSDNISGI